MFYSRQHIMLLWVFLQVPSSQKKQRNQTIEFSWELYCLVVLFLLFYVICASVPTEGTAVVFPGITTSGKSLMKITKNNGPNKEPSGTPEGMTYQVEL